MAKFIKDLGTRRSGSKMKRYYLVECLSCDKQYETPMAYFKKAPDSTCKICQRESRASNANIVAGKNFIQKSIKKHGKRYDYSKVVYTTYEGEVTIICSKHGPFQQLPRNHLSGNGCFSCSIDEKASINRKDPIIFRKEFEEKYGEEYELLSEYDFANNKIWLNHKLCSNKPFRMSPKHFINYEQRCPHCAVRGFKIKSPGILYVVKFIFEDIINIKIGITNKSKISERYSKEEMLNMTILLEWKNQDGELIQDIEVYLKQTYKKLRLYKDNKKPKNFLLLTGYTECFKEEILNDLVIKEMMK